MSVLYLMLGVLLLGAQQVAQKEYNKRAQGGTFTYTLIAILAACIVFLITSGGKLEFRWDVALYAVLFAVGYSLSMVMSFLAIKTGSLSVSSLILQYSLIIPAVYGMTMLGETVKITLFIGLALLIASLALVNLGGKGESVRPTLKWAFFALLAFLGNGVCATVQKVQQVDFEGKYKSEFMLIGLALSALLLLVLVLVTERKTLLYNLKKGSPIAVGGGLSNGVCNFLMMVLAGMLPASVMYPIVSAGGTIVTSLAAFFIYREKMSRLQLLGLALGIFAIVALNL